MVEWISVEDGLPEIGEPVSIIINLDDLPLSPAIEGLEGILVSREQSGIWYVLETRSVIGNITHWKPEPSKQETPKAITIDIHINDKRIDVNDFASYVAEAMKKAIRRW